jgi:hypothetical protein
VGLIVLKPYRQAPSSITVNPGVLYLHFIMDWTSKSYSSVGLIVLKPCRLAPSSIMANPGVFYLHFLLAGQANRIARWDSALVFVLCWCIGNVRCQPGEVSVNSRDWQTEATCPTLSIHSFSRAFIHTFTERSDLFVGWQLLSWRQGEERRWSTGARQTIWFLHSRKHITNLCRLIWRYLGGELKNDVITAGNANN